MRRSRSSNLAVYVILGVWALIVLFPLYTMIANSLKRQREIFRNPFLPPWPFEFEGYSTAWSDGRFDLYFRNSLFVTVISLLLIIFLGSLAAYALAMTIGRGTFGPLNVMLLTTALLGAGLFLAVETRAASPLIHMTMFRNPLLTASLAMSMLVSTVMMATLVVGPFYLAQTLGLDAALTGLALSVGPLAAALTGVPAGRMTDRHGAQPMTIVGLIGLATGSLMLSRLPETMGLAGYLSPIVIITIGYALFQTANNTAVMADARPETRGLVSGLLALACKILLQLIDCRGKNVVQLLNCGSCMMNRHQLGQTFRCRFLKVEGHQGIPLGKNPEFTHRTWHVHVIKHVG